MSTILSDDFNRADNDTLGGNWVEGAEPGGGANWKILSNKLRDDTINGFNYALAKNTTSVGSADYEVECDLPTVGNTSHECVGRYVDGNNYYSGGNNGPAGVTEIRKRVSGSETQLGTNPGVSAATVKFSMQGTALKLYVSGSQVISQTDSSLSSEGNHGVLEVGAAGGDFDNYNVYSFGGAGILYSQLEHAVLRGSNRGVLLGVR